ncbi:peptidoglycan-binding domain-containing protein [Antribacter gilvus]|uniref:peptidoglycan-binding domain-containing protein n=1 Tax=Antribacter gilvus TaxID=2304675 RepID=UPI000F7AB447|nr:peptidoglycan-binding protein [Antribacter gilvus]
MSLALVLTVVPSNAAMAYSASNPTLTGLPVVGLNYVRQGNLVGFWQNILYADSYITKCLSVNSLHAIDGHFGSRSHQYTGYWQSHFGLTGDGIVGPNTWGNMWSRVYASNSSLGDGHVHYYKYYDGSFHDISFIRLTTTSAYDHALEGEWGFHSKSNPNGDMADLDYPAITFYPC